MADNPSPEEERRQVRGVADQALVFALRDDWEQAEEVVEELLEGLPDGEDAGQYVVALLLAWSDTLMAFHPHLAAGGEMTAVWDLVDEGNSITDPDDLSDHTRWATSFLMARARGDHPGMTLLLRDLPRLVGPYMAALLSAVAQTLHALPTFTGDLEQVPRACFEVMAARAREAEQALGLLCRQEVYIQGDGAFREMDPREAVGYLEVRGWRLEEQGPAEQVRSRDGFCVAVPLDASCEDYTERMRSLVHDLARAEMRSAAAVLVELAGMGPGFSA